MKRILFLLLFPCVLFGQDFPEEQLASIAMAKRTSIVDDTTIVGTLTGVRDVMGYDFRADSVRVGDKFIDAAGRIHTIETISSRGVNYLNVQVVTKDTVFFDFSGRGVLWRPDSLGLIPLGPVANGLVSPSLAAKIHNHNLAILSSLPDTVKFDSLIAGDNLTIDYTDPRNPVIAVPSLNDLDADPTNELYDDTELRDSITALRNDIGSGGGGSGTVETVVAGTGISVNSTDPANPIVTNTAPDQTVSLNEGSNVTISGTYPNFTITVPTLDDPDADATNELQTISKLGQTVTLSGGGGSFTDDDTQLNEAQVDAFVGNNGYATGSGTSTRLVQWNGSTGLANSSAYESSSEFVFEKPIDWRFNGEILQLGNSTFADKYINFRPGSAGGGLIGFTDFDANGENGLLLQAGTVKSIIFSTDSDSRTWSPADYDLFISDESTVGFGTNDRTAHLNTLTPSFSGREEVLKSRVSDSNNFFGIGNGTNGNGQFLPTFYGYNTQNNRWALEFRGIYNPSNETAGQADTEAGILFRVTRTGNTSDPFNGSLNQVQNVAIARFLNGETPVFSILNNGDLDGDEWGLAMSQSATNGQVLAFNSTTSLFEPTTASGSADGNGILEDAGPHNLNDGTVVRGATETGGSIGRWELGNAVSAAGTGFNYLRMYGNSSRGLNLQMQVNESTGDVTDASLSLSNPIDESEFTHDGDWTFTSAGSYRRGFDWTLNALLFSGADYNLLPSASPDVDRSAWTSNSDKTFEYTPVAATYTKRLTADASRTTTSLLAISDLSFSGLPAGTYDVKVVLNWTEDTTPDGTTFDLKIDWTTTNLNTSISGRPMGTGILGVQTETLPWSTDGDYSTVGTHANMQTLVIPGGTAVFTGTGSFTLRAAAYKPSETITIKEGSHIILTKID